MHRVEIENRCLREIKNLDKSVLKKAFKIIETVIAHDPYSGKPLTGQYKGLYSYRFSDFRIIYEIIKERIVVVILRIRHRKDVYDGL